MSNEPILIIDDNPMNRKLAKVLLEIEGYLVQTAVDAREAMDAIRSFKPRLILMDLQLPGEDGLELTRKLKADPKYRDVIIVMSSSYDQKGLEMKAREFGCDDYINKPINVKTLPVLVAGYLRAGKQ